MLDTPVYPSVPLPGIPQTPNFICTRAGLPKTSLTVEQPLIPSSASCGTTVYSTRAGTPVYPSAPLPGIPQTPDFICTRAGLPKTSLTVEQPLIPSSASCGTTVYSTRAGTPVYPSAPLPGIPQTPDFICTRAGLPKTSLTVEQPLIPSSASCGTTVYSTRAGTPVYPSAPLPGIPQTPDFICTRAGLPKTSLTVEQPLIPSSASCGTTVYSTRAGTPVYPSAPLPGILQTDF